MQVHMTKGDSVSLTWAIGCWEVRRYNNRALNRAYLGPIAFLADAADLLSSSRHVYLHAVDGQVCALHPHRLAPTNILQAMHFSEAQLLCQASLGIRESADITSVETAVCAHLQGIV